MYNIGRSVLTHEGPNAAPVDQEQVRPKAERQLTEGDVNFLKIEEAVDTLEMEHNAQGQKILLFKTPTCPNCKAAGALLDKAGVGYQALNANEERELVEKYGVRQAPTLVLLEGSSFEKYRGVSDIKGWLMKRRELVHQ